MEKRKSNELESIVKNSMVSALKLYQATRPFRIPRCRFYPSCSQYASQSIERFGVIKGVLLTSWRLMRCQPFCAGGVDEVPVQFHMLKRS